MLLGEGKVFSQHPQTGCRALPRPREETARQGVGETGPASGAVRVPNGEPGTERKYWCRWKTQAFNGNVFLLSYVSTSTVTILAFFI